MGVGQMFQIALYEPEIPPNTGNIIRLCANTGTLLHLIHPLGFAPDDKQLKRAGLDYHEWASVQHHDNYGSFVEKLPSSRIFACSTHGTRCYSDVVYEEGDVLLFGPETRGLPKALLQGFAKDTIIRIPMLPTSRSLNLSNAVAVILYEALRQRRFTGLG